ncbi:MAG: hypothetical protein JSU70_07345 [Phycisphaerales bacterium]|nr:MAG: hypothetical protein JSU70_07345 [Phycisphaerales bacterium]
MDKKPTIVTSVALSILLFAASAHAEDPLGLAVAPKTGTLGAGGEVTARLASNFNARAGVNAFGLSFAGTQDDIAYNVGLNFLSFSALLDWYLFNNSFRISGGILVNESEFRLTARSATSYEIGGTVYTPAQVGTLSGTVSFDDVAPYVGIGWGNPFTGNRRLGFACDIGVAYTGSPHVALAATGAVASVDLRAEERNFENEIEEYKFYPVFALSLYYRF